MRLLSRNISILLMSVLALSTVVTVANSECVFKGCSCKFEDAYRVEECKVLDGEFPERVLSENPELIDTIDLSSSGIKSIPDNQFNGLSIDFLGLDENLLTVLKANAFANADASMLVLSSNGLRSIERGAFTPLRDSLHTLLLSENKLSEMGIYLTY